MHVAFPLMLVVFLSSALMACQDINVKDIEKAVEQAQQDLNKPSNKEMVAGVKAALDQGIGSAVDSLSVKNGFNGSDLVRLALPPELAKYEKDLRNLGLGSYVDDFVVTMNRAAENAAPQAKSIFVSAIQDMSVTDVVDILQGEDNAATQYFRGKTEADLSSAFLPEVSAATDSVGLTKSYKKITDLASPFINLGSAADLDAYVTGQALNGLFVYVQQEEKNIRENSAARGSEILKKVFGYFDEQ